MQQGWTSLHVAAFQGHLEVVKYLIECGGEKLLMLTGNVRAEINVCMLLWLEESTVSW
jgi:hypothetical protein